MSTWQRLWVFENVFSTWKCSKNNWKIASDFMSFMPWRKVPFIWTLLDWWLFDVRFNFLAFIFCAVFIMQHFKKHVPINWLEWPYRILKKKKKCQFLSLPLNSRIRSMSGKGPGLCILTSSGESDTGSFENTGPGGERQVKDNYNLSWCILRSR